MTRDTRRQWSRLAVVSWPGFWIMAVYSAVSIVLSNPDLVGAPILGRLPIALGAEVLLFGLLLIAKRTFLRPTVAHRPVFIAATLVAASVLRAVAVAVALEVVGITEGIDWELRLPGAILGFSTALLVLNALLGFVAEHRVRETQLRRRQEQARQARDYSVRQMREHRSDTVDKLRQQILEAVEAAVAEDPHMAATALRGVADDLVRPLSHRLAQMLEPMPQSTEAVGHHRFDLGSYLTGAGDARPFAPGWTAVLFLVFGGPSVLAALPTAKAVWVLAVGGGSVFVLLVLANEVMARVPVASPNRRFVLAVGLAVVAGLALAASTPLFVGGPAALVLLVEIGDLLLLPLLTLVMLLLRGAKRKQERLEGELLEAEADLHWEATRVRCVQWREQRSLARAMHGPVQSAIGIGVLRLESAVSADSLDEDLVTSVRDEVVTTVRSLDTAQDDAHHLTSVMEETAATWQGVCDVTWPISPSASDRLSQDDVAASTTVGLFSEACWNAIRHAHAESIECVLQLVDERTLRLTVRNDGAPLPLDAPPGLGTRMLTDMTLRHRLVRSGHWTVLAADIPVE